MTPIKNILERVLVPLEAAFIETPHAANVDLANTIRSSRILVGSPNGTGDLRALLEAQGYTNYAVESAPERVLDSYAAEKARLVIVDIEHFGKTGFELTRDVVRRFAGECSSAVAVVPQHDPAIRGAALNAGAKDLIDRPFDPIETGLRIRNRLEFCALIDQVHDQNHALEDKIRQRTRELNASQLDLVHRLARAAEFRDSDTAFHVARMSLYAAELGRAAGLGEHECQLLLSASALHDIGKIGVSDSILLKPGMHSDEETRTMRSHVEMGVEILRGSEHELLQWAEVIARTHHERYDGSGYPMGLAGENIPLIGRIVAICDVFDALTTPRPYKHAWPFEAAVNEIRQGAGTHFDPRLVELFMEILPRMQMIQSSYAAALSEIYA